MKTIMMTAAGVIALAGAANAADLDLFRGSTKDSPAYIEQISAFPWTGFYLGGTVGFGTGDAETTLSEGDGEYSYSLTGDNDIDGAIYGIHLGYNAQRGNIVFGVEGGIYGTELDTDGQNLLIPITHETEVDWYGRVIGRLGVTTGSTLFYGFGGIAIGDVTSTLSATDGRQSESISLSDEQHIGWTAGAGIEHVIGKGWIARVEYAHVDLGEEKSSLSFGEKSDSISVSQDVDWDQVTVGLNYKF